MSPHSKLSSGSRLFLSFSIVASVFALVPATASAQWSTDPAVNLAVATGAGEQVQPKIAPTADGGCFLSWYDGASGYDVRVQKLDASGNEVMAHNGVLVADRSFSSTQDYGLDVDASGNALLVFRDDRLGGTQITAAKIAPDGTALWGATGVQLTSTTDFVAAPKIAGSSDGGVVVAWTQDVDTRVQKLDANGTPVWASDVVLSPGTGSYSASDLHGAGDGAILSFIHQTGGFGSPRHIIAQKFDGSGSLLWGSAHVSVFDGGSVQFGNFPTFILDGDGGAVFSWYDAATSSLQCSVQRILTTGVEAFPHNGVVVSTIASRVRVSPSVDFDPMTEEVFAFWKEQTTSQSQAGVYGQKIDVNGVRQWTDAGAMVVALSSDDINNIETWAVDGGAMVFWDRAPAFAQDRIYGARLDASGTIDLPTFDVASVVSNKSRLQVREGALGFAILAWQDGRTDASDVYAQNINADGSLGGDTTSAPDGAIRLVSAAYATPNPASGRVEIVLSRSEGNGLVLGRPELDRVASSAEVFDVHGRSVRSGLVASNAGMRLVWDGRADDGRSVAPGVYFVRFAGEGAGVPVTVVR